MRALSFMKWVTMCLRKEKFIGKRQEQMMAEKIKSYEDDPCYMYYNSLCYLRDAPDRDNFRLDFLYKYMDMKDEEEYQDW